MPHQLPSATPTTEDLPLAYAEHLTQASHTLHSLTHQDLAEIIREHKALNPELPMKQQVKEALQRWVEFGILPGSFLLAVLENDLIESLGRADSYNRATLFQICQYVYHCLPTEAWGSPEKVQKWHAGFQLTNNA